MEALLHLVMGRLNGSSPRQTNAKEPKLPVLEVPRPRLLTPSPSREDLGMVRCAIHATAYSEFFRKLPRELRRRILIEAFGGYIVHMDLDYDHPEKPVTEKKTARGDPSQRIVTHGNWNRIDHPWRYTSPWTVLDTSKPKEWRWRSSECHRGLPSELVDRENRFLYAGSWNAGEDRCRHGGKERSNICQLVRGEDHTKCFVGAMGWLLTCRQAYTEGVEVLYGTNTIHSSSKGMLLSLDRFLIPQRLAQIRSLEVSWGFTSDGPRSRRTLQPYSNKLSFHRFLWKIPSMLPSLQHLVICIQGDWVNQQTTPDRGFLNVLLPMDALAVHLGPQIQSLTLAVSSILYRQFREWALLDDAVVQQVWLGCSHERIWRTLDEHRDDIGWEPNLDGYWVQLGARDIPEPIFCDFESDVENEDVQNSVLYENRARRAVGHIQ